MSSAQTLPELSINEDAETRKNWKLEVGVDKAPLVNRISSFESKNLDDIDGPSSIQLGVGKVHAQSGNASNSVENRRPVSCI